jgi:hypothetical protein
MGKNPVPAKKRAIFDRISLPVPEIVLGEGREMEEPAGPEYPVDLPCHKVAAVPGQVADQVPGKNGIAGTCPEGDGPGIGKDDMARSVTVLTGPCCCNGRLGEVEGHYVMAPAQEEARILPVATAEFQDPGMGRQFRNRRGCPPIELPASPVRIIPDYPVIGHFPASPCIMVCTHTPYTLPMKWKWFRSV